ITSVEYYDTVFAIAESPLQKGMLWAGTDDGLIHLTRDDGKTWENVTPKDMPEWALVSIIEASHFDPGTAYAAIDLHKLDQLTPLIYKTHDFGQTWTRISNGIPAGAYTRAVREDPKVKGLLYAGTETGVFFSIDDGAHWQPLQLNLPTTPVHDLAVKDSDLVAATHGRSFWILDDVSPLRQASSSIPREDFHLYSPATAVRLHFPGQVDRKRPVGDNPPKGAVLYYYLKAKPAAKEEITLDVFDAQGRHVRRLSNLEDNKNEQPPEWPDQERPSNLLPADAGLNRFAWDFRSDPPAQIPGAFYEGEPPRGPLVLPGSYQVKLTVKGKTQAASLQIINDPRLKSTVSEADLQKQAELTTNVKADIDNLHRAVNQIRGLRAGLQGLQKQSGAAAPSSDVTAAAKALDQKMTPVEETLMQVKIKSSEGNLRYPNRLNEQYASFNDLIQSFDQAPTAQQLLVYDDLHTRLTAELAKWQQIQTADVPALNDLMRKSGGQSLTVGNGLGD
ncbi:MAG TPA: glycosyl hydrolase, partial [Candidatus Angelobacter sp.]|nr:glycosyl hydrolase [Candidatus Angelobacter sp.]